MGLCVLCFSITTYTDRKQVALEETALDAAKSSIVYGVTKNVATAGRAVRVFIRTRIMLTAIIGC
jgi:hypothetical protein